MAERGLGPSNAPGLPIRPSSNVASGSKQGREGEEEEVQQRRKHEAIVQELLSASVPGKAEAHCPSECLHSCPGGLKKGRKRLSECGHR